MEQRTSNAYWVRKKQRGHVGNAITTHVSRIKRAYAVVIMRYKTAITISLWKALISHRPEIYLKKYDNRIRI